MPYIMYVALQGDDKLARFSMDPDTGKLTLQEEIRRSSGPAPLAVDPQRRFLYVGRRGAHHLEFSHRAADGTPDAYW
jgi:6-phosphogluconolactonase (cycloisomerase 2 family)